MLSLLRLVEDDTAALRGSVVLLFKTFAATMLVAMNRFAALFITLFAASSFAGTLAQFRTPFGDMEVELFDQARPVTVSNFIKYVESGRYTDTFSHRLVPGFVATNRGTTNWDFHAVVTNAPIVNEFGLAPPLSNVFGTIAMAKVAGNTNSATSQWFFNLANNTALDANDTTNMFVVFGKVVRGTNVLNVFNSFQYWSSPWAAPIPATNRVLQGFYNPPYNNWPLLQTAATAAASIVDTNFLFIDITLLKVAVRPLTGGSREISWNSATGLTNVLEFTTNFPPSWQTALTTNGTGNRITVTNTSPDPKRFYRIRATY
jgi:cyclophilin family peptidyl-prolyl cis-trans isomerase